MTVTLTFNRSLVSIMRMKTDTVSEMLAFYANNLTKL